MRFGNVRLITRIAACPLFLSIRQPRKKRARPAEKGERTIQIVMRTLIFSLAAVVFCSIPQPIRAQADAGQSSSFQGKYIRKDKTSDFMTLGPDGAFTLFLGGKLHGGTYKIEGDTLAVTGPGINGHLKETRITGNTIRDPLGTLWEKRGGSGQTSAPAAVSVQDTPPAARHKYEDLPVPQPPPAPAATISIGQTKAQVTAAFGEPQRKAAAGPKDIFFYTDLKMKVTFTNGKVSAIE